MQTRARTRATCRGVAILGARWQSAPMRRLARVAAVAALLVAVVGLLVPTDRLVRSLLARITFPDGQYVTFRRASLRPWGLLLNGAAYRRSDGEPIVETEWLQVRPSWTALWRDRLGRPWHVSAGIFGGRVAASVDPGPGDRALDATWTDVDIGQLLDVLGREDPIAGRATGQAAVRIPVDGDPSGSGTLAVRDGSWSPPVDELDEVTLHADTAALHWGLGERRLDVTQAEVRGPEVELTAHGRMGVAQNLGESTLDLDVVIEPMPGAPRQLRRLLERLPHQNDGAASVRITGTLDSPRTDDD